MEDKIIIYNSDDGNSKVVLMEREGMVWLNQAQMAELFATSKQNISTHIGNILSDNELSYNSVVKDYLTTASDGKSYTVKFYSLQMILSVGFRVRNPRGVQFRRWANNNLTEYLQKGFIIDDERMKNPGGRVDYFDELLERIAEIRASEKRFYQKVRDIFALSSDYQSDDKAIQMFYAATQNKLLYAVTGHTAAEIIIDRANATKPNMGLTSWKGKVVRLGDVALAKNYLSQSELKDLNDLVVIFLDSAQFMARRRNDITMQFWRDNVDSMIASHGMSVLKNTGNRSADAAESFARAQYTEFNARRKAEEKAVADAEDKHLIADAERRISRLMSAKGKK